MKNYYPLIKQNKTRFGFKCMAMGALLITNLSTSAQTASSLNFDGADDKVDIPHDPAFNFSNQLTIEMWVNTSASGQQFITTKNEDSWYMAVNGDNNHSGKASVFLNGIVPGGWLNGTSTISDGNWHHLAATYNGSKLKLYVDGALEAVSSSTGAVSTGTSNIKIGMRPFFPFQSFFTGSLDEFRIWNVARSQCEINAYMKCEVPTTAAGLVANYHFNQGTASGSNSSVSTLTSATGSYNGTLTNFALTGPASNWIALAGVTSGSSTPLSIPSFSAGSSHSLVCAGESVTLTAASANTYTWSSGGNSASTIINPTSNAIYTVTAFNGICEVMATVPMSVNACTGINESKLSNLQIFPVPANESINIQFSANENVLVELFSTDGRKITSVLVEGHAHSLNVSELNSGLYLLKLSTDKETVSKIIVKQ
ncbi:MAG: T9SS type A sorting domain-containing protein [Bacteroidia bacterium]|nr:T9SS type A sorting domain-containing protein [Bacteroidia bacterium]